MLFTYSSIRLDVEGEAKERPRRWNKWEEETEIVKASIFYTRKYIQTTPHPQSSEKNKLTNPSIHPSIHQLINGRV